MKVLPLTLALLGATLTFRPSRADDQEPTYDGRTLSDWIGDLSRGTLSNDAIFYQSLTAYEALREIGPAAVPALIDLLASESAVRRKNAAIALGMLGPEARAAVDGLVALLEDDSPAIRATTAEALGKIGAEARDAIPALASALEDSESHWVPPHAVWRVSDYAADALVKVGPDSAPALQKALEDEDPIVRFVACQALGRLPAAKRTSAAKLTAALDDPEPLVRAHAAEALGRLQVKEAVPLLITRLTDDGSYGIGINGVGRVRYSAAEALRQIGLAAKDVPALVKLLDHDKAEARTAAARFLASRGPAAEQAIPKLRESCADEQMRIDAAAALLQITPHDSVGQATLLEALQDEDEWKRCEAAANVGSLQPIPPTLRRALSEATRDRNGDVRIAAAGALLRADPSDRPALAVFLRELADTDNYVWFDGEEVATLLKRLGPNAKEVVPTLVEVLRKQDPDQSELAAEWLAVIGPRAAGAVPALVGAIEDPERQILVEEQVYKTLGALGPAASAALPTLKKDFANGNYEAAEPSARIGGAGVVALCDALAGGNLKTRIAAARALAHSADQQDAAMLALTRALEDARVDVRVQAARSLGELGAAGARAIPALERASHDDYLVVRTAALEALEKLRP